MRHSSGNGLGVNDACDIKPDLPLYKGVSYRVGKTSYEQYYLEPGESFSELSDFNAGTLWLITAQKEGYLQIEDEIL
jgi:hypothetical protein